MLRVSPVRSSRPQNWILGSLMINIWGYCAINGAIAVPTALRDNMREAATAYFTGISEHEWHLVTWNLLVVNVAFPIASAISQALFWPLVNVYVMMVFTDVAQLPKSWLYGETLESDDHQVPSPASPCAFILKRVHVVGLRYLTARALPVLRVISVLAASSS